MRTRKMWANKRVIIRVDDLDLFFKMACALCSDRDKTDMSTSCDDELIHGRRWVFRGQANKEWDIKSTIERCPVNRHMAHGSGKLLEQKLVRAFVRDASCHMSFRGLELFDVLSLMRHYGVPTRLVDFSESPFVALYFSMEEWINADFCVWAVCLDDLMAYSGVEGGNVIDWPWIGMTQLHTSKHADWQKKFLDEFWMKTETDSTKGVFYAYPHHGNVRQIVQSGLFLVPNSLTTPFMVNLTYAFNCECARPKVTTLTNLYKRDRVFDVIKLSGIIQFVFNCGLRDQCQSLLRSMNISPKMLYPGLEGVGKSLKQYVSAFDNGDEELSSELL